MEGTQVSHMLSGATRLSAPYAKRLRLELINGVWLETAASNAIRRANALSSLPVASDEPSLRRSLSSTPKGHEHD